MISFDSFKNISQKSGNGKIKSIARYVLPIFAALAPLSGYAQDTYQLPYPDKSIVYLNPNGFDNSNIDPNNIRTNHEEDPFFVKNLMVSGDHHRYFTGDPTNWADQAYVEITINGGKDHTSEAGGLTLYDNNNNLVSDHLVLYIRRAEEIDMQGNDFANDQPTIFRVMGQFEGDKTGNVENWRELCYIFMMYSGSYTKEFSSRVAIKKFWMNMKENDKDGAPFAYMHTPENKYGKGPNDINDENDRYRLWTKAAFNEDGSPRRLIKMRFYVEANHNRNFGTKGYRSMVMSRFDVIRLSPTEPYEDPTVYGDNSFKDRFHLHSDYDKTYDVVGHKFHNTQGIFDDINKINGWTENRNKISSMLDDKNRVILNGITTDITMPSYAYIDKENNNGEIIDDDQIRQPTHTVEHIIYAIPGDMVALYPYYEMAGHTQFNDNFAHWYDYKTGGRLVYNAPWSEIDYDLLDFAIDPSGIKISDYGFYGFNESSSTAYRQYGNYATFFMPRNPYIAEIDQHRMFDDLDDYDDDDENEFVIAADFSQEFNFGTHVSKNADKSITEPIISTRHLFRIRGGKAFADEFSGSKEKNEEYIRKNQKMVSARAYVPFQIRFDSPVPASPTTRSNYYYKVNDKEYRRVCEMDIRVLDPNTREDITNNPGTPKFDFGETSSFTGKGTRKIDGVDYSLCDGNGSFYRMLICNDPGEGNFIVQLIGKDINGQQITIYEEPDENDASAESAASDNSDAPLVVMEYNITFLPPTSASMITFDTLYGDDADDTFKHAREEELVAKYGEPKTFIDFDEYYLFNKLEDTNTKNLFISNVNSKANSVRQLNEKIDPLVGNDGNSYDVTYFKWPLPWNNSSYSFGYDDRHDFNMYMLATNAQIVPYCSSGGIHENEDGTKGLFDVTYYKNKRQNVSRGIGEKQGYFYYVNAATDPGVSARLSIENLCPGSTVHVSAWIAEMSSNIETENLSFNFVAVLKENSADFTFPDDPILQPGDRIVLHQFITGYVPTSSTSAGAVVGRLSNELDLGDRQNHVGEWLNVYYSFVPRLSEFSSNGITSDMIDHYELELDNNCKSSSGADYAVDDIRVYIVSPVIYADQVEPLCTDAHSTTVLVESQFDTLIQSVGKQEATGNNEGELIAMYYAILDKEKFENAYGNNGNIGQEAFDASVVPVKDLNYGSLSFSTRWKENEANKDQENATSYGDTKDGQRVIVLNCDLTDDDLRPGKDYIIALRMPLETTDVLDEGSEWLFFDPTNDCAKVCEFTVKGANVVKVDGVVVEEYDKVTVCENQQPVVQVNIMEMDDNGDLDLYDKNGMFDWFYGDLAAFETYELDGVKLSEALTVFREYYPNLETFDGFKLSGAENNKEESLTQGMIDVIKKASSPRPVEGSENMLPALLSLRQSSYVFPPITFEQGEDARECRVVAIPIVGDMEDSEGKTVRLCTAPTEVRIKAENQAPQLAHGIPAITYPDLITDVPLRIGLDKLNSVSVDMNSASDQIQKGLVIPVRMVASSAEQQPERMTLLNDDASIVLVQTNDPQYKDLGVENEDDFVLREIGKVVDLTALLGEHDDNSFRAVFDRDFKFKEGYYYRMRFQYEDVSGQTCKGQDVFTIKVVPAYQMWVGAEGANWNNDANWRRVTSGELLSESPENMDEYDKKDYVSNGASTTTRSYTPLDFTKVIIPAGSVYPQLDERMHSREHLASNSETVNVAYDSGSVSFDWVKDAPEAAEYGEESTASTDYIQYDMVYHTLTGDNDIYCRPWYANAAAEIHFNTNAEILNQQHLDYQKAWVDMEMETGRWYTAAIPLQGVVAGDMYLPSDNGRQGTELFADITFDQAKHDRFAPAVYQRGWDKGDETVYRLDDSNVGANDKVQNVAVQMNWSHVYNDVTEQYTPGTGFSVKNDVSRLEETSQPEFVKFRFPKADAEYDYHDLDKEHYNTENGNTFSRTNPGRLVDIENGAYTATLTNANVGNKLFLVGNPFMSHLDMAAFLDANKTVIQPKFWILTEDKKLSASLDEDGKVIEANGEDVATIAPMQGFFVEAKDPKVQISLTFTSDMMLLGYVEDDFEGPQTRASESEIEADIIVSTKSSRALVFASSDADKLYDSSEDVQLLNDRTLGSESKVFTIAGDMATVINRTSDIEGLEVGVIAREDEENVISFDGNIPDGYFLYDSASGEMTPLCQGLEKRVTGTVSGRLFITRAETEMIAAEAMKIVGNHGTVTATAPEAYGPIVVKVYDMVGQLIEEAYGEVSVSLNVGRGIYLVDVAASNGAHKSAKLAF